ncbi:LysE/ArgO family amino acid transporter, partial [Nitratidesulfovibrio liaohensis]
MHLAPYLQGLGIGASLIIAIGAQNAFVLTQSLRRNHHMAVAALCALIDVVLITAGVAGVGTAVAASPLLRQGAAVG